MVSQFPARDRDEPATKADLALTRAELRAEMGEIRTDMADLRTDMADLRTEMHKEIHELGDRLTNRMITVAGVGLAAITGLLALFS